jgi:hypothetical protein
MQYYDDMLHGRCFTLSSLPCYNLTPAHPTVRLDARMLHVTAFTLTRIISVM